MTYVRLVLNLAVVLGAFAACADDWPEVQGAGRRSLWEETGILRQFPAGGLSYTWRTAIGAGYSGPAVAGGRVFVADYITRDGVGSERALCLDEQTGAILWTHENPAAEYKKFAYNSGPRATPTVDGDRVYFLGGAGDLYCLDVATGTLRWQVNFPRDFGSRIPTWGFAGAPLAHQGLVLCAAGGKDNARLVALDRNTGAVVWKALPSNSDLGYAPPILINAAGVDQLIHQAANTVAAVNPLTGAVLWEQAIEASIPCATPVVADDKLFVTDFWQGSTLLRLLPNRPGVEVLWHRKGANEVNTDALHGLMCTPIIADGCIFGIDSYGQLRGLKLDTGDRLWETIDATQEKARWANAFLFRNRDAYFIVNDRGELVIAELSATGYKELGRVNLIEPTTGGGGTRELKLVNWVLPAFANGHIVTRNDREIVRARLTP